jgi:Lar family restriction alleviation protein
MSNGTLSSPDTEIDAQLLPCPFCGESPELRYIMECGEVFSAWVRCKCGAERRESRTKAIAIEKWNTRPGLAKQPSQKPVAWRRRHGPSPWIYSEEKPEGPSIHLFEVEALVRAVPVTSTDRGMQESIARKALDALADKVSSKIAQLEHYKEYDCHLDHARTIAEGRISQANQILHWIAEAAIQHGPLYLL